MGEHWYVGKDGQRSGPFTSAQVQRMAAAGELRPTDMLWMEGMANWVQAQTVRGLFPAQPFAVASPAANPYAAPTARDIAGETSGGTMEYAEFFPRVAASILDGLISGLLGCIPAIGIAEAFRPFAADSNAPVAAMMIGNCLAQIVSILIGLAYYVVLETSQKQATAGKQAVGIKVTDLQGNRLTVGRAVARYFAKIFITGLTFGIGFLMPLFTDRKQTLHDMIAGCLVLKK